MFNRLKNMIRRELDMIVEAWITGQVPDRKTFGDDLSDLDRFHQLDYHLTQPRSVRVSRSDFGLSDAPPIIRTQNHEARPAITQPVATDTINQLLRKIGSVYAGRSRNVPAEIIGHRKAYKFKFKPKRFRKEIMCDSSYEQRVAEAIDQDDTYIVACDAQSTKIEGTICGHVKTYWPDFLLYTQDNAIIILEVKNVENILEDQFFLKAKLCRQLCQKLNWGFAVTIPGLPPIATLLHLAIPNGAKEKLQDYIAGRKIYHSFNSGIKKASAEWVKRGYRLDEVTWLALCLQLKVATKTVANRTYYGLLSNNQAWDDVLVAQATS